MEFLGLRFRTMLFLVAFLYPAFVESLIRHYKFSVVYKNTTNLCSSKPIVTVNGKFPGPTLYAREDDTVIVRVTNHVKYNVTIHWHGVKQRRTGWSDGPAYITQCPIQPGQNYIYNFTLTGQRGTLLWHAHDSWLRATLHGAIVILPKRGTPYPFPTPDEEKIIIMAEWWKSDVEDVINQATQSGLPPNVSDAHTINGRVGPLPGCSSQGTEMGYTWYHTCDLPKLTLLPVQAKCSKGCNITILCFAYVLGGYTLHVESGKTYMLRIVNAALNDELFFKVAGHNLTVVEVDASYTKPFQTDTIYTGPGQTTNAILTANQGIGKYFITASPFMDAPIGFDNATVIATLRYKGTPANPTAILTSIPPRNATPLTDTFVDSLRSLNSKQYPADVPLTIDHSLFFTISVGVNPCATCVNGSKLASAINNVSFVMPSISLLQAYYYNVKGVYTLDFPANPPIPFNYTGTPPKNLQTTNGTRLYRLEYNSTVQIVLQGTAIIAPESHPTHLHGFNFFVVGKGLGNFDPKKDPEKFNLVDPVERNTVSAPTAGWTAIRFRANNPGIWFLHCHLEVHTSWGLKMAFLVENGEGQNESLPPPPTDLPTC